MEISRRGFCHRVGNTLPANSVAPVSEPSFRKPVEWNRMDCGHFPQALHRRGAATGPMKAVRIGLCVLYAFSVFAHGVVEVWSQSILEIGACFLLIAWAVIIYQDREESIQWSPLNWPLIGFVAIAIFQLAFHLTATPFLTR